MVKIPDILARKQALDISRHVHVESPAGAGKTGLIIERILMLLSVVNHPSEILAMTFTRKAAAEMKDRVLGILKAADENKISDDEYLNSLLEKGKKVLSKYRGVRREMLLSGAELQITTIHGFCLRVCRRAPLESGLEPGLRLVEDREQERLQELAAREMIRELLSRPTDDPTRKALESRLLMHNMDTRGIIREVSSLIAKRDQLGDLLVELPFMDNSEVFRERCQENLAKIIGTRLEKLREKIENTPLGKNWDEFIKYLSDHGAECLDIFPARCPSGNWRDLEEWQNLANVFLTQSGKIRKRWGPKSGGMPKGFSSTDWCNAILAFDDEFIESLHEVRNYPAESALWEEVAAMEDLVLIVSAALEKYRNICRSLGVMDYVDVELGALKALGSVENITDSLLFWDRSIKHILVDEFQDTSATEYRIIQFLVSGWEAGDRRTLFVVGDPKQSIYRFRKADVSIFYKAEAGVERPGADPIKLNPVKLHTNFRSADNLVEWTNQVFGETIMSRPRVEYEEVKFIEAVGCHENIDGDDVSLALFVPESEDDLPRNREALYLAKAVADRLEVLRTGETIGILLFTRTHLPVYLKAFKKMKIPLQVKEGLKLAEVPEVVHLASLARAIVRPHDQLAWIACLRSPWLTLPISVIREIVESEGETVFRKLKSLETRFGELRQFKKAMIEARSRIGRDKLGEVLKKTWTTLGGARKVASFAGLEGLKGCLKFLEQLCEEEKGTPEETLEQMEFLLENLYDPGELSSGDSPVYLMTVHGAKGLEFDHCFIPWLDYQPLRSGQGEKPAYLSASLDGVPVIVSRPDKRVESKNSVYDFFFKIEQRKIVAEAKRLFYVAVTRARKSLFMSGIWSGKSLPESPLGWVLRHLGIKPKSENAGEARYGSTLVQFNPVAEVTDKRVEKYFIPPPREHASFKPEPIPFKVSKPSGLGYEGSGSEDVMDEGTLYSKEKGTVVHKIIEQLSRGLDLPDIPYVERLLRFQGVPPAESEKIAREILGELEKCLLDPFFRWITSNDFPWSASEWCVESIAGENTIISGVIDRVVFDGEKFWLVDFKTHRPLDNESTDDFVKRMKRKFSLQLNEYKRLLSSTKNVPYEQIRAGLLLTNLPKWVEV